MTHAERVAERVFEELDRLFAEAGGADYIGEPVSQVEHALQCADRALRAGAAESSVLAALFHDVGHLRYPEGAARMEGLGVVDHEGHGARWLGELGFSVEVQELVRGHVQAKRYLVAKNPRYLERLSEASLGTLRLQGGPMSVDEMADFENDPLFKRKLAIRQWDEESKDVDARVPGLEFYREFIARDLSLDSERKMFGKESQVFEGVLARPS